MMDCTNHDEDIAEIWLSLSIHPALSRPIQQPLARQGWEPLECGKAKLRSTINVKHTTNFEVLYQKEKEKVKYII